MPLPHDPGPHWGEVGIHGLHRQREWDAVGTVEAPGLDGEEVELVELAGGGTVVLGDLALDPAPLVGAIQLPAPFRARAVRRSGDLWVVAARAIEVARLAAEPGGDEVEVVWDGRAGSARVDGEEVPHGFPELDRIGRARHREYVVRAARLRDGLWEIAVSPL